MASTGPSDVEVRLRKLAERILGTEVDVDTTLLEESGNSLALSELVVAVEQEFGVTIEDRVIGRIRVLRDLIAIVETERAS